MRRHYHGDFILKYAYGDVFLEGDKWKRCEYISEGGEVMYVSSILEIEEVAAFIANMNKDATHHVGYCEMRKRSCYRQLFMIFQI